MGIHLVHSISLFNSSLMGEEKKVSRNQNRLLCVTYISIETNTKKVHKNEVHSSPIAFFSRRKKKNRFFHLFFVLYCFLFCIVLLFRIVSCFDYFCEELRVILQG